MIAILIVIILFVIIGWRMLRSLIDRAELRIEWNRKQDRFALEHQIAELTKRVAALEQRQLSYGGMSEPVPERKAVLDIPFRPAVQEKPAGAEPIAPSSEAPQPEIASPEPALADPAPTRSRWSDRVRHTVGNEEWERLFAGSVLNKIGALVFVIGVALFLGYSFKHINAAGRAISATVFSTAMLAGGVVLERRQMYRLFSRGLIGAGWAAFYVTAYAMYALPAAKVITNPFAGSMLLLAVAAAMIAHSLRYRAQGVTSVAYFSAFAALAVTPSTPFAVASLIPLAASLLYFAWRFEWHTMALFGLFATYATCISRGSSNAPLYATESLFLVYWLLFETFDILRAHRGSRAFGVAWIFPLNAVAFLALSYRAWLTHDSLHMWRMAALAAAVFLASAVARMFVRPAYATVNETDPFERIRAGTYEAPLTVAALLAAAAIFGRVRGFWTNVSLAAEAELLYLAGVRFRSGLLRALGALGFVTSLSDVAITSWREPGKVSILTLPLANWAPSVLFHSVLFYLNRALRADTPFAYAATALLAVVLASQTNAHAAPVLLLVFGLALLEVGLRKTLTDFRLQAYFVALAAILLEISHDDFMANAGFAVWGACGACAIACWFFSIRILTAQSSGLDAAENSLMRNVLAGAGCLFALFTTWMLMPLEATTFVWTGLGLTWLAVAFRFRATFFAWMAAAILAITSISATFNNLDELWTRKNYVGPLPAPLLVLAALYLVCYFFSRMQEARHQRFASGFTWLPAILAACTAYAHLYGFYVPSAWALLALIFLATGMYTRLASFWIQSYAMAVLACLSCVSFDFTNSGAATIVPRILAVALSIAAFLIAEFLVRRNTQKLTPRERVARSFFSLAAIVLLTGLLYHEVSGGMLTVVWGVEALACLGAGIVARERPLRVEGLALLLVCILKLFIYDLRNLETGYRILSFIALGIILLAVSWIYTRFRAQVERYL